MREMIGHFPGDRIIGSGHTVSNIDWSLLLFNRVVISNDLFLILQHPLTDMQSTLLTVFKKSVFIGFQLDNTGHLSHNFLHDEMETAGLILFVPLP
jgi:hypothetical protein